MVKYVGFVTPPSRPDQKAFIMTFWFILALVCALATATVMAAGLVSMGRGGAFNTRYGNLLMRLRLLFQGLSIACLLIGATTS